MAIQMRRGTYEQFDPSRMLPGEWAVVLSGDSDATDGRTAYICFAAGDVKRVATEEDLPGAATESSVGLVRPDGKTVTAAADGTISARDTTYGIRVEGHRLYLVPGGSVTRADLPDDDTRYGLAIDGHTVRLVPGGRFDSVTVPDDDTTYPDATQSASGLMSAADKRRLDGLSEVTWGEL